MWEDGRRGEGRDTKVGWVCVCVDICDLLHGSAAMYCTRDETPLVG